MSISADTETDKWENAVKQDSLIWHNTRKVLDFENGVAKLTFGFNGVGHNFLLNKERKVIGRDISADSLCKTLQKAFSNNSN